MTTDPTNHRLAGQSWLDNAIAWYGQIDDSDPWEKTTASALIAGVFFLAARDEDLGGEDTMARTTWFPIDLDDPLDGEEQHQSEKFEAAGMTPDGLPTQELINRPIDWDVIYGPNRERFESGPRRELDEDNPDTLVGDAGLTEDVADTIARPISVPRPAPWGDPWGGNGWGAA